jgi:hypothetical protein
MRRHPVFHLRLAPQINACAAGIAQQSARLALEPPHHGAAHHAMLTGNPNELIGQIKKHLRMPFPHRLWLR